MKVVLIGKTNVGKSTLFNRLIEERRAIVSDQPHTTRDRIYQECSWRNQKFTLVDVGGISLEKPKEKELEDEIKNQIEISLKEADLIIFLVEADGLTHEDRLIAQKIKKIKKPIILAVNKVDGDKKQKFINENFLKLGLGKPLIISAANGMGTGDLLDEICKKLSTNNKLISSQNTKTKKIEEKSYENVIRVGFLGKTNVGKSTLLNALLNEQRVIVSSLRHTTREPIDANFYYQNQKIIFIDTAGIRKKNKIKSAIEKTGITRSLKVIENSDVILIILDITERTSGTEKELLTLIKNKKRGVLLIVNKSDLVEDAPKELRRRYQNKFQSLWEAPIIFISAKNKINLNKILNHIIQIVKRMKKKYNTERLQATINQAIEKYHFKQNYWSKAKINQVEAEIPTFEIKLPRISNKEIMPRPAQFNILEKEIRRAFDLWGVPINLTNIH